MTASTAGQTELNYGLVISTLEASSKNERSVEYRQYITAGIPHQDAGFSHTFRGVTENNPSRPSNSTDGLGSSPGWYTVGGT
jgi:hypothetical protein